MHLMYRAGEIGDGLMPVEHGGELDHDRRCLASSISFRVSTSGMQSAIA